MNLRPDKYFEEMQPVGSIHGNDLTQGIETHSEISTKNKPPRWHVLKELRRNVQRDSEVFVIAGEKTDKQEIEGDCLIIWQRTPGLQRKGVGGSSVHNHELG